MKDALWSIIYTLVSFVGSACLLRAWGNRIPGSLRNPLGQFVMAITDWIVKPLRKFMPSNKGVDWSSVVAAVVIALVLAIIYMLLIVGSPNKVPNFGAIALIAVMWVVKWALYTAIGLLIIMAVLSWVNPNAPIAPAVEQWTTPLLAPVRKILPTIGGFDLSPLVVIVLIQALLILVESLLPSFMQLAL